MHQKEYIQKEQVLHVIRRSDCPLEETTWRSLEDFMRPHGEGMGTVRSSLPTNCSKAMREICLIRPDQPYLLLDVLRQFQ